MKFRSNLLTLSLMMIFSILATKAGAQGIAVNTSGANADSSAVLDVSSTDQGMLIPRMTTLQRDAIVNPAVGLIIYNTDTDCINYYKNTSWFQVCGDCIAPLAPTASANGPLCAGDTLHLSATTVPGATYTWTGPSGFSSNQQNPVLNGVTAAHAGNYSVSAVVSGCPSAVSSVYVAVGAIPVSSFYAIPASGNIGDTTTFYPNQAAASYSWTFPSGSPASSTAQNPEVSWSAAGTYNISLTLTDNGCTSTSTLPYTVINCPSGSQTFTYTGSVQTFVVPACVDSILVEAWGAEGGVTDNYPNSGGLGGYAKAKIPVTGGETIQVYVGGMGGSGTNLTSGGWNGGGGTNTTCTGHNIGAGGGASDIRRSPYSLNDRLIVGAGGGGAGYDPVQYQTWGGAGGGLTGGNGVTASWCTPDCHGKGGTQTFGGAGGQRSGEPNAQSGSFGLGGRGQGSCSGGGGGGGGWYGGGGGNATAGGGGSSFVDAPGNAQKVTTAGQRQGNGQVVISY